MDKEIEIKFNEIPSPQNNTIRIEDIWGVIKTIDTEPTYTPRKLNEQFVIYTNGATLRFYWYDITNNVWHYVTATA